MSPPLVGGGLVYVCSVKQKQYKMIYKITLDVLDRKPILPYSYQYEMGSWIYDLIRWANPNYADFLHHQGYQNGKKRFKMFAFSRLNIPRRKSMKYGLQVLSNKVSFKISFLTDTAATHAIIGLLQNDQVMLGNRNTQVRFKINRISTITPTIESNTVRLKTLSPIFIKDKNDQHLAPTANGYTNLLINNLLQKYTIAVKNQWLPLEKTEQTIDFKLLSQQPERKGIHIKNHKKRQTKLIAYNYEFELTAPKSLIQTGLMAGFGGLNAQGFGFCEILKN